MNIYNDVYTFDDIKEYMIKDALRIETIIEDYNSFNYEIQGKEIIDFFQKIFENKTLEFNIKIKS